MHHQDACARLRLRTHSRQLPVSGHHRHADAASEHARHAGNPDAQLSQRLQRVPSGAILYPDDMDKAAVFLCSDTAAGIIGTSLVVDGGYTACAEFLP